MWMLPNPFAKELHYIEITSCKIPSFVAIRGKIQFLSENLWHKKIYDRLSVSQTDNIPKLVFTYIYGLFLFLNSKSHQVLPAV